MTSAAATMVGAWLWRSASRSSSRRRRVHAGFEVVGALAGTSRVESWLLAVELLLL